MLSRRLRSCVRTIRRERRFLRKITRVVLRQAAHYFICRHLNKTFHASRTSGVKQDLCADDVRAKEFSAVSNTTIDVRLCREIYDRFTTRGQGSVNGFRRRDIAMDEVVSRRVQSVQVIEVSRVR